MTSEGVDAGFVEGEFSRGGGAAGSGAGFGAGNGGASGCSGNTAGGTASVARDVAGGGAAAPVGGTLTVLMGIGADSTCWCS